MLTKLIGVIAAVAVLGTGAFVYQSNAPSTGAADTAGATGESGCCSSGTSCCIEGESAACCSPVVGACCSEGEAPAACCSEGEATKACCSEGETEACCSEGEATKACCSEGEAKTCDVTSCDREDCEGCESCKGEAKCCAESTEEAPAETPAN